MFTLYIAKQNFIQRIRWKDVRNSNNILRPILFNFLFDMMIWLVSVNGLWRAILSWWFQYCSHERQWFKTINVDGLEMCSINTNFPISNPTTNQCSHVLYHKNKETICIKYAFSLSPSLPHIPSSKTRLCIRKVSQPLLKSALRSQPRGR